MEYAVVLYQQGDVWCAEVPDFDYSGGFAPTRDEVLALIRTFIQDVRASYRDQGEHHRPTTTCVMLAIDEDAPHSPDDQGDASEGEHP